MIPVANGIEYVNHPGRRSGRGVPQGAEYNKGGFTGTVGSNRKLICF
jgi:hypothetical protein